jgi:AGZA family xanthine/uracil permease-like MFS transporter
VFDNAGTLIGVTHRTGLMKNGKLARMKQALISDSFAAMFGALIGTSTTTSYIESAAGVSAGGRTGLTALFVGLFFVLALFSRRSRGWFLLMLRRRRCSMSLV